MRPRTTAGALLASLALLAAPVVSLPDLRLAGVPLTTAAAEPVPVEPEVSSVPLPQDEPATTEVDVAEGTTVLGVTWRSPDAEAAPAVQVRAERDGEWGAWVDVPPNDEGPDAGTTEAARAEAAGTVRATDPVDVAGAERVQVRTTDVEQVEDLEVALVDPGESAADAAVGQWTPPASAAAAVARPTVVSRAQWGADESLRSCTPSTAPRLEGVVIHHTADRNTYTAAEAPAMVRSIYAYHTKVNKWCDVGYNALVDRFGRIYEGRAGGLERNVVGAHAAGFNTGTWGVSVIGNFETAALPAAAQASVERLVAWRLGVAGLDATAWKTFTSLGSNKYPAGTAVRLPTVFAHRDVGLTACPGQLYYDKLGAVRANIARLAAAAATPPPAPPPAPAPAPAPSPSLRLTDYTSDRATDLLGVSTGGGLFLYPGDGDGGFGDYGKIGKGWGGMSLVTAAGDRTGDGHGDVYARDGSGQLWLYPSDGRRSWTPRVLVSAGWDSLTQLIPVGNWDGAGRDDVLARDTLGRLWLYTADGSGRLVSRTQVGSGWAAFTAVFSPGDWDGDGHPDLLTRDRAGLLRLYPGNGRGGFRPAQAIGHGWGTFTALVSAGDWDGDRRPDVLARDGLGRLYLYAGNGRGGWVTGRQQLIGTGWGGLTSIL